MRSQNAGVLELADETDSKSVVSDGVWVQVPPPAPEPQDLLGVSFFTLVPSVLPWRFLYLMTGWYHRRKKLKADAGRPPEHR